MFQPAFGWAQHPKAGQNTQRYFTTLYEKGIKENQNKPMETSQK